MLQFFTIIIFIVGSVLARRRELPMFRLDGDHVQVGTTQGFKGTSRQVGKDGDGDGDDVDDGDGDHVQVGTTQGFKRTSRQVGKETNITPKYLSIQDHCLVVSCLGHLSFSLFYLETQMIKMKASENLIPKGARIS